MRKIFRYELRRAVCNKFFLGLLVVSLYFGWQTLNSEVIKGIAHTAPFSPWSFGYYSAQVCPLLSVALLFFLWGIFFKGGPPGQTPDRRNPRECWKLSHGEMCCCGGGLAVVGRVCLCTGDGLLATLFGGGCLHWRTAHPRSGFSASGICLCPGAGHGSRPYPPGPDSGIDARDVVYQSVAASRRVGVVWGYMVSEYPLTLETLDPAFALPASVWGIKTIFLLVGMGLIALTIRLETKSS